MGWARAWVRGSVRAWVRGSVRAWEVEARDLLALEGTREHL